ncbi:YbeD family protein [Alloalcanivorax profundimaris]|uniref:YbeD family protein n=1 Tax=Alloalcanivorax profundimaris TaxID=2735259 RepID=UPI000C368FCE|nr:DUF493 domain-containing protein [Alloalcanivorax profundimaris]MAO59381.1 DUF493 domain-containing protein [Alcanivorax sp.]MBM1143510.1 DUF493 domain-containing protein [Alcanivorax sp. ZXX171]MCQ6261163.1 DUF493 domain-containing protein [Alcanivorax sp. MM125-6]UWN51127.1 hypothetical protein ASALC70_03352 [Alcanivorax sp. ALC70]MAY12111.1 DUF493 domain-containing protein [Alcanivorax sp.]|tara:strand:+ start:302 stop:568 length:267 start_codon:yes stop_codon:yes gene_type:complete
MIREELWDFPHSMQLKVMGAADAPLEEAVVEILETHLDDFDRHAHLSSKPSTKGNFVSLTASVVLRDRDQLETVYRELNACPHVKITL